MLLFSHRNFALLWWAGLLSVMGNWALQIALPIYIYETTGSTLATGLMFAMSTVPRVLLGSVAGIFVDRWDRRRTLIVANFLSFVGLLPLLLISGSELLWLIYLVAFAQAVISQFSGPAENALLPALVNEDRLASANALNALNNNIGRLVGPALGGVLMSNLGLQAVVVYDAVTFLLASLLIAFIRIRTVQNSEEPADGQRDGPAVGLSAVWRDWLEGLRIVKRNRVVLVLFTYIAVTSVGEGVMAALFIPFVSDVLKGTSLDVGWLLSAQAVGGIIGGLIVSVVAARFLPARLLGWGSVGVGIIDVAIFNYPSLLSGVTLGIVLFALAGFPVSALQAGLMTLFQTSVDGKFLGRVFGAFGTTAALFKLIGIGAGGFLGDKLGIVPVINTQAAVYVVGGLWVLAMLSRPSQLSLDKEE